MKDTLWKLPLAGVLTATIVASLGACSTQPADTHVVSYVGQDLLSATPAPTTAQAAKPSPVQVFLRDVGRPDTAANEQAVTSEVTLICGIFTSGVPLDDDSTNGISNAELVKALNDSGLCGRTDLTVPPTAWPTN